MFRHVACGKLLDQMAEFFFESISLFVENICSLATHGPVMFNLYAILAATLDPLPPLDPLPSSWIPS